MTKKPSDSNLESFVAALDDTRKEDRIIEESKEVIFAGNVAEISEEKEKTELTHTQVAEECDLSSLAILHSSIKIFEEKFFSFARVNLVITSGFLLALFALLFFLESSVPDIESAFAHPKREGSLLIGVILLSLAFFTWLRSSFLTVVDDYFDEDLDRPPLSFGCKKLFSFMVLEAMQFLLIVIGSLLVFLAPFFCARYFLAMPILIEEDEDAIGAMLKSAQRVEFWMILTMRAMILISFFVVFFLVSGHFALHYFVKNSLILYSALFFFFSFFLLPIHCCFRFVLNKKITHMVKSESLQIITSSNKIFFVFSRTALLAGIIVFFLLFISEASGSRSILSIDSIMQRAGVSSFFENLLSHEGQYSATSHN